MGSADGGLVLYENVGDAGKPLFERTDLLDGVVVGDADSTPSLVDIQGDGAIDLVVGSSGGKLVYYRNVGSTGFERVEGADDPFAGIDVGENSAPHFSIWTTTAMSTSSWARRTASSTITRTWGHRRSQRL